MEQLENLPQDILQLIFKSCDTKTLHALFCVSNLTRIIVQQLLQEIKQLEKDDNVKYISPLVYFLLNKSNTKITNGQKLDILTAIKKLSLTCVETNDELINLVLKLMPDVLKEKIEKTLEIALATGEIKLLTQQPLYTSYDDKMKHVFIGFFLTAMEDYALSHREITSISLPPSLKTIGVWAFAYCTSLVSINLPNSLESIGERAFFYCKGLQSVSLPPSLMSIGYSGFQDCTSLRSLNIPESVKIIDQCAYAKCKNITSISLPLFLTSIGECTFTKCTNLRFIEIRTTVFPEPVHCQELSSMVLELPTEATRNFAIRELFNFYTNENERIQKALEQAREDDANGRIFNYDFVEDEDDSDEVVTLQDRDIRQREQEQVEGEAERLQEAASASTGGDARIDTGASSSSASFPSGGTEISHHLQPIGVGEAAAQYSEITPSEEAENLGNPPPTEAEQAAALHQEKLRKLHEHIKAERDDLRGLLKASCENEATLIRLQTENRELLRQVEEIKGPRPY